MAIGDRVLLVRTITKMSGSQFAQYGTKVERKLQQAVFEVGQRARDMARRAAPVDTGALRSSIYVTKGAVDRSATGLMSHKPGNAFTKQSSLGYFRSLNAAMKKNKRIKTFPMMSEHGITAPESHGAAYEYDTYAANKILPGQFGRFDIGTSGVLRNGGSLLGTSLELHRTHGEGNVRVTGPNSPFTLHTYKTYGSDVEDALLPLAMEMGSAGRGNLFITLGASAYYAGYVEFGHTVPGGKTIPARQFLTPSVYWAFDEVKVQIARTLQENGIPSGRL